MSIATAPSLPAGRLMSVDALRALAALAVTWFHLTNGYPQDSWVKASGSFGWLGVEAFFVISGFIIPYSLHRTGYVPKKNAKQFLLKRLIRLEPPYLASIVLVIVLSELSAMAPGFKGQPVHYTWSQLLSHVGYLAGIIGYDWINVVYWTLAIEFQFYLIMAVMVIFVLKSSAILFLATAGAVALASKILQDSIPILHFGPVFFIGIAVCRGVIGMDLRRTSMTLVVCLLLATALLISWQCAAASFLAVAILSIKTIKINRYLRHISVISFSLYLIHVPIGGRVVNLLRRFGDGEFYFLMTSLSGLLVSLCAAHLSWWMIERPALRWAARVHKIDLPK